MRGDFSRDTFDEAKGYSRVLMQQGRVQLDADWNEQGDIFAASLRSLAADVIGAHGGPARRNGFQISSFKDGDFEIGAGRYYVDGLLCECSNATSYSAQPHYRQGRPPLPAGMSYFVYLEVWEREVSSLDDASLVDPALGREDTALRSKLCWRVRAVPTQNLDPKLQAALQAVDGGALDETARDELDDALPYLSRSLEPMLRARALHADEDTLLRVEVHERAEGTAPLVLKWSRRNASFQYQVHAEPLEDGLRLNVRGVSLLSGPVEVGTWIELLDPTQVVEGVPGPLLRVRAVRHGVMLGGIDGQASEHVDQIDVELQGTSPQLASEQLRARHWEGKVDAATASVDWARLGALAEIAVVDAKRARPGDAWMLPLRSSTGRSIDGWPPEGRRPVDARRQFAPLSLMTGNAIIDLRREFRGIAGPTAP